MVNIEQGVGHAVDGVAVFVGVPHRQPGEVALTARTAIAVEVPRHGNRLGVAGRIDQHGRVPSGRERVAVHRFDPHRVRGRVDQRVETGRRQRRWRSGRRLR
jgi:hypothetical protein